MNDTYYLSTGETDRLRLTILNRIYNAGMQQFLLESDLKKGMTVLEIGCGTGEMACWTAKQVGEKGRVIAIDNSEAQLEICRQTAKQHGVSNVEFRLCDINEVEKLNTSFDFIYGRWALIFIPQPETAVKKLAAILKPGGVLAYAALNMKDNGHFSYPQENILTEWHQLGVDNFIRLGLDVNFATRAIHIWRELGLTNLKAKTQQPILVTPEEKSVYRLGLLTVSKSSLENKHITETKLKEMLHALEAFEKSSGIAGFFRNILVSGVRSLQQ